MTRFRFAVIVVSAALLWPAGAAAQSSERTLSAVGRGSVELRPDGGNFAVVVRQTASTANRARRLANARFAGVVRALKAAGVTQDQLTTEQVSVSRNRRRGRDGDEPTPVRFRAFVFVQVTVDGLKPLARAIDAATRGGATDVFGPELTVSDERQRGGKTRAEAMAFVDARGRADAAAAANGQQIVGIQSIDLDPDSDGFDPSFGAALDGSGGSRAGRTQIFAARQTFTSRVRITYLIEPAA